MYYLPATPPFSNDATQSALDNEAAKYTGPETRVDCGPVRERAAAQLKSLAAACSASRTMSAAPADEDDTAGAVRARTADASEPASAEIDDGAAREKRRKAKSKALAEAVTNESDLESDEGDASGPCKAELVRLAAAPWTGTCAVCLKDGVPCVGATSTRRCDYCRSKHKRCPHCKSFLSLHNLSD